MAIYLVVGGGMLVFPVAALVAIILFAFGEDSNAGRFAPWLILCLWGLILVLMWRHFVRKGRAWTEPRLSTQEFFYFQVAAAFMVLGFTALLRAIPDDVNSFFAEALRTLFDALLVLFNLAYISIAWGMRFRLPPKTYLAALGALAIVLITRLI
ncbi:MAG: hypothetical protein PHN82_04805 [bacterium]|nr:hypothetical protein [bacterium]